MMNQESGYTNIAERLVHKTANIIEPKMRAAYFFKKLIPISDEGIVEVLNIVFMKAGKIRGHHSDALELFINPETMTTYLGEKRCSELRNIADENDHKHLLIILGAEVKTNDKRMDSEEFPYDFEEIAIGQRKSMAAKNDPDLIDNMLRDPEPMVIEKLLMNPRVTEKDVMKIVTRRPNDPKIIRIVAQSAKWNSSYTIKDAIVRNPYTSADIALKIMPTLMKQHLEEIVNDGGLSENLTLVARQILNKKAGKDTDNQEIDSE